MSRPPRDTPARRKLMERVSIIEEAAKSLPKHHIGSAEPNMPIKRTPPLSLQGSREIRDELSRAPEDTPERREFMKLVRAMKALRGRLDLERRHPETPAPTDRTNLLKVAAAMLGGVLMGVLLARRRVR